MVNDVAEHECSERCRQGQAEERLASLAPRRYCGQFRVAPAEQSPGGSGPLTELGQQSVAKGHAG